MRNVMAHQNFTNYPNVLELLTKTEKLFLDIQKMENCMPLQVGDRLFCGSLLFILFCLFWKDLTNHYHGFKI